IDRMNRKTSTEPNNVPLLKGSTCRVTGSWIPYIPFTGAKSRSRTRPPKSRGESTYLNVPATAGPVELVLARGNEEGHEPDDNQDKSQNSDRRGESALSLLAGWERRRIVSVERAILIVRRTCGSAHCLVSPHVSGATGQTSQTRRLCQPRRRLSLSPPSPTRPIRRLSAQA